MTAFEEMLRQGWEPLQYAAFFGALTIFAILEIALGRRAMRADGPRETGRRRRWPANAGLTILNILVLGALPVSALFAADYAQSRGWGPLNDPVLLPVAAIAIGFVLRSLVSYAIHVAMHKVPILWRLHRVHHTDTEMDISTTVRFHPLEFAFAIPVVILSVIALGIPPVAIMLYELFDAAVAVFTHANIRLPRWLDRGFRTVVVTPNMHRVHHSSRPAETDSNYGATIVWWDKLFGTYREVGGGALAAMRIGLRECRDRRADSLPWLLLLPFRSLVIPPIRETETARRPGGKRIGVPTS